MNLSEIREAYEELSGSASKINRNLCFAGFALIWIFNPNNYKNAGLLDTNLVVPALFFVLALAVDLFQYVISTTTWYFYYVNQKKKMKSDEKEDTFSVNEPEGKNTLVWHFFGFKILLMLIGYVILFIKIL